jgi:hypothetical protein
MAELTFDQAREAVRAENEADWENEDYPGTYMVAPYGWEDDQAFLVIEGAQEYLEDGDVEYEIQDAPAVFVDKATGVVFTAEFLAVQDRIQAMTPVGDHPDDDPEEDQED